MSTTSLGLLASVICSSEDTATIQYCGTYIVESTLSVEKPLCPGIKSVLPSKNKGLQEMFEKPLCPGINKKGGTVNDLPMICGYRYKNQKTIPLYY